MFLIKFPCVRSPARACTITMRMEASRAISCTRVYDHDAHGGLACESLARACTLTMSTEESPDPTRLCSVNFRNYICYGSPNVC